VRDLREVSDYETEFNAADYSSKMFNMFSGEFGKVKLLCELDMREQIVDRFGKKAPLTAVNADHFETEIEAAISDGFVSWVMQFGDKIKVVEPTFLAEKIKEKAQIIANMY
jgi:predicted DNA-binding transcriptional regulator YafY